MKSDLKTDVEAVRHLIEFLNSDLSYREFIEPLKRLADIAESVSNGITLMRNGEVPLTAEDRIDTWPQWKRDAFSEMFEKK